MLLCLIKISEQQKDHKFHSFLFSFFIGTIFLAVQINSNLGASPQLECWNNGPATGGIDDKIKMVNILLKTNIPSFHHSIIPFFGANSEVPKNLYILSRL